MEALDAILPGLGSSALFVFVFIRYVRTDRLTSESFGAINQSLQVEIERLHVETNRLHEIVNALRDENEALRERLRTLEERAR